MRPETRRFLTIVADHISQGIWDSVAHATAVFGLNESETWTLGIIVDSDPELVQFGRPEGWYADGLTGPVGV